MSALFHFTLTLERPELLHSLLILYLVVIGSLILCSRGNCWREVCCRSSLASLQAITVPQPFGKGLLLNVWSPHRICRAFPAHRTKKGSKRPIFLVYVIYYNFFHVFCSFYMISAISPDLGVAQFTKTWPS